MRDLVFVAYHFPPLRGSSGIQRTLSFARNLPRFGWRPHILTTTERAYEQVSAESLSLIPPGTSVYRACALDVKRHLAIGGRYPDFLAVPDRWLSWALSGIVEGVKLARAVRPAAICSTYPIATAHIIGYGVSKLTGLPWVADLRDPMLQPGFPHGWLRRKSFGWIERLIVAHASRMVVTTPGAAEFYRQRYPKLPAERVVVIENGYDEEMFPEERAPDTVERGPGRVLTLLHSGIMYAHDRDPSQFFMALREVLAEASELPLRVRVILRAPGTEMQFAEMARQHGVGDIVEVAPAIPYREALKEMMAADALLIFQSRGCNHQIPAKAYEYLNAGRPIIGITDPAGDTGRLLLAQGVRAVAALEDKDAIKAMLRECLPSVRDNTISLPSNEQVAKLSRRARTREFAQLLDEIAVAG
jgi:glycosyltransferase involved in cell wall biosynthesis